MATKSMSNSRPLTAATWSSDWVDAGRRATRRRTTSPIAAGISPISARCGASLTSSFTSSHTKNGLPSVRACRLASTSAGTSCAVSRTYASTAAGARGPSATRRQPGWRARSPMASVTASGRAPSCSRAVTASITPGAFAYVATKRRSRSDDASAQCRSSSTTNTGCADATRSTTRVTVSNWRNRAASASPLSTAARPSSGNSAARSARSLSDGAAARLATTARNDCTHGHSGGAPSSS